tara:strand:+ start:1627 stop:1791 length:165 start_codon:yes stop_codon:yes gene_type:complete
MARAPQWQQRAISQVQWRLEMEKFEQRHAAAQAEEKRAISPICDTTYHPLVSRI